MSEPSPHPPRLAEWLLERLLSPEYDAVLGDLAEDYADHAVHYGRRRAALIYWGEALRTAPPLAFYDLIWHSVMVKNYVKIAFRNLKKHGTFTAINVLGLALSMSVCLLVIALIRDQARSDRFHEKADRIYRMISEKETPYGRWKMATSPGPLAPALLSEAPDVEEAVRFTKLGGNATYGDQTFRVDGLYAEPAFFDVFDFDLARGDERTALKAPFSLLLTPETARKFFGDADPIGQVIHRDGVGDFTVTGVLAEVPHRTHLAFEALASFSTLEALEDGYHVDDWNHTTTHYTYFVLADGAQPEAVAALSNELVARHYTDEDAPPVLDVQALTNINLGPEMSNQVGPVMPASTAYTLSVFALVLMLIAIFNYASLTAARSLKRAREIGLRKVVGARRGQIVRQFLMEAVVVSGLALVLATALMALLLPGFNGLRGFQEDLDMGTLSVDWIRDGGTYLLFLAFAVGVGVVAGLVPAYKMASYAPTQVLRGLTTVHGFSALGLRRVLIVGQFTLAIIGIITTMVVYRQVSFLPNADHGFGEEQLVNVDLQGVPYETLRNEWVRLPGVVQVAATSSPPVVGPKTWTDIRADGMDRPILIQFYSVDAPFLGQFRLDVLAGRTFEETLAGADEEEPIWLTQKALGALGWQAPEEAVGQVVSFDNSPEPHTAVVAGVVSDFYARGYERGYTPVVLRRLPERYHHAIVRVRPGAFQGTLAALESTWKAVAPTQVFTYAFYDDELAQEYLFIQDVVKFVGLLAGFVVFIACLGLLGMASYTAETRTKEVGIRKVLGADVRSIVLLLSRDYVRLLLVAVAIGMPLAYLFNRRLLQGFANHVSLNGWIFVAGIVPVLVLALLTVGSQTVKAGYTNPVDTLRQE